jgi:predicted glycoside hydrolase/deacetylase ChbG (UPF0249 family)
MLIVNADDLGYSRGVDEAVVRAHRDGVVRSTSLLVTFPRSAEAAEMARAERGLEIGLHLDLVEGTPVSDPFAVGTLVGDDGRFVGLRELVTRLATGRVRASEVALELRAQVSRARSLGTPALAWDSHRHVHLLPLLARVVASVAKEQGARWVRRAAPPGWPVAWKAGLLGVATAGSELFLRDIPGSDWYVDLSSRMPPPDASQVALLAALPGLGELSAHPGVAHGNGAADPLAHRRPIDLALLTDPLLRRAFGTEAVRWRVPG